MKASDLVASIVSNPKAHQVNREEKIQATIEVMASNAENMINKGEGFAINRSENSRGYGKGRLMGD